MKKNWPRQVLVVVLMALGTASFVVPAYTLLFPPVVTAQVAQTPSSTNDLPANFQSLGIANYIQLQDAENTKDGSIISHVDTVYKLSQGIADKSMIGVYDTTPALAFEPEDTVNLVPVITSGNVEVIVNLSGGPIAKGDAITSSTTPGEGMKAGKSGFVLGIAQADFTEAQGPLGQIPVLLDIKFSYGADSPNSEKITSRLLTILSASSIAAIEDPAVAFRTLVAAGILILSLVISFATFSRVAQKGIDALGRNPLASRMIGIGIAMNIAVSILIIVGGIAGAYFVITM